MLELENEAATVALADALHRAMPADRAGWTLLLKGELGAGKSTLARALIRAMGHGGTVPSPTYTLIEPYDLPAGKVYHVDLYRISDPDELRFLGFAELDDGLRLVEWPDRAPALAATADLRIGLSFAGAGRRAVLTGLTPRGTALVTDLEHALTEPAD